MKRHILTIAILLVALGFYTLGFSGLGIAAFVAGVTFELWFWARLIVRSRSATGPDASHT
jgi:hypothetical protein